MFTYTAYPPQYSSLLILPHLQLQKCPPPLRTTTTTTTTATSSFYFPYQNPNSSFHLLRHLHICTCRRTWDPNAESFRTRSFNSNSNFNSEDDDNDASPDTGQWYEVLEEFIDQVWIFKVFGSYGWMLPAIIISLLLATGPKAFLVALALPLGQSAFSLAFQKLRGRTKKNRKQKAKTKKRPRTRTRSNVKLREEEEAENQGTKKRKMGYQSWAAGNDVPVDDKGGLGPTSFGGWDELDGQTEFNMRAVRKSARTAGGPRMTEKGKFSRREENGDMPLLLRMLIAVFPFLGSWTKML